MRRAGSPVQDSSGPRIAKSTFAACRIFATAVATDLLRWSNEPIQPTQYITSASGFSPSRGIFRLAAHSARLSLLITHGLPLRSILLKSDVTSVGNSLSSITSERRISTIFGTCSIETGQISMQAVQVVQDQSAAFEMMLPIIVS